MYEIFEMLLKEHGVTAYRVSKETGVTTATLTSWKQGKYTPKPEKLQKIADYFGVTLDYLMTGNETQELLYTCPDCGLSYHANQAEDCNYHTFHHKAWKKAVEKFGELYCNSAINEKIKEENRTIRNNLNNTINDRYNAELKVLRCLYSRSVSATDFNLEHVSFDEYVAMMMNTEKYRNKLGNDLSEKLIAKYGTLPGIENGETYYHIPSNIRQLSQKDNRDIKKDLEKLMKKLSNQEYGPAAYDGEEIPEADLELFEGQLELMLRRLKAINKEKYNPRKNKK